MSEDDLLRNPDDETNVRWQNDKETRGGAATDRPPPWSVGDQLHDFVLEELLGSGSSGYVYRVRDATNGRRFALKLLKHGPPDDLLRNKLGFRRMMTIDHPNLLRVDRIHQLGSYIALSMEEVEGHTFRRARVELRELPRDVAYEALLKLLRDYAAGLAVMHGHGFVHRDIKPENVMVDRGGNGRVIDYGLVDAYELNETSIGTRRFLLGTPHYIAPEVIYRQQYLPAGDIFSLGMMTLDTLRMLERAADQDVTDVKRSEDSQTEDAARIGEAIEQLPDSVPTILRETCREMLDRHAADRPTAMALARLGLPPSQQIPWTIEPPMLGRDSETEQCKEWVDGIFSGKLGRLHLTGDSGLGKTRLAQDIISYIESKNWGQVFYSRCRVREDQPLQAFDQICDAIAHRYMSGDREKVQLDPVSVEILQSVFPLLKNVLVSTLQLAPAGESNQRWDALEAAARFSEQLRQVGPLFIVIDDSQWADRDSRGVLDRLQSAECGVGLGIVTVSRSRQDPQHCPATSYLHLRPLESSDSVQLLRNAAKRWGTGVTDGILRRLARLAGGSPFRLQELAEEFRPGGALHDVSTDSNSDIADLAPLHRLWQRRAERLSNEARRVLPFIVTAGGNVSLEQLGELTGLDESVDAAVSELVQQRLAIDEATGGECITIYHDRVADELIKTFSDQVKHEAHNAWAALLVRQDNPESLAARIAGHWFAAGQPGRAIAHAILAAEDAERRLAMGEAGRWYAKVIHHVSGEERVRQLRNAARCFYQADHPVQAAKYYQELSQLLDGDERLECMLLATAMSIRCGRFEQVRQQLQELAGILNLPKPKSSWKSKLALSAAVARVSVGGYHKLLSGISEETERPPTAGASHEATGPSVSDSPRKKRQQQAMRLCLSLVRPLSLFDNQYAAELSLAGTLLATTHGDAKEKVHAAVARAVFGCYDKGRRRIESEASLLMLKPLVERIGHHTATGDLWAGIAYSHALACRWDQVGQPVETAVKYYDRLTDTHGFEVAHTRWLDLWANWHLGRWDAMRQLGDRMFEDATRRDDLFQRVVAMGGYGVGTWLIRDRTDELQIVQRQTREMLGETEQVQLFHVFDWIASIQTMLYQGNYEQAWQTHQSFEPTMRRQPFRQLQMLRTAQSLLGATISWNRLVTEQSNHWVAPLESFVRSLRQEQTGFADVMADLFGGLMLSQQADSNATGEQALTMLKRASEQSRQRRLRPYYLIAEDAIGSIESGHGDQLIQQKMRKANVARPDRLQRLYALPSGSSQ